MVTTSVLEQEGGPCWFGSAFTSRFTAEPGYIQKVRTIATEEKKNEETFSAKLLTDLFPGRLV